ncbi:ataxin-1a [Stegostoma tigrinum]|uniref:ataxin-1a n=1 Tax=Stegostoma tigrinum TaxID=3053191 RepID=UPI00202B2287|nr:ataxin-1a [Stegostoma tigrinum]XP_048411068.1 ataxin-1a [Stegostoma tigrinum]XP_048411088.1 ataxin-1a [Stegostoma tigrinum]XP_048411096.1 ataxin-1a [Stegostoma tigrinum]XP_048411106.1 ataxin-1a [Stegostoma tigrinum]XP_048411114.1 ataxin-1a [Stegostoma tigrinum]XP_048411122.1 ataxin-1a [Stegostoma tigrinum]XP_048411131.1 ataxin-1a [Stegostoma tigrinum]XP_059509470.1 ataxin-1a [Stegostoma tigrinum]XP_059509473.1 ataxin-1a [Stegostoma tigrinum]XP_059509486.1 ataxin-1a [Stegostoma tigrinum
MKSNQERNNECLPPKKREFPVNHLPLPEKAGAAATVSESSRGENLAWLANVTSSQSSVGMRYGQGKVAAETPVETGLPLYKPLAAAVDYSSPGSVRSAPGVTHLRAVCSSSALAQPGPSASPVEYAPLQHAAFQFVGPPYSGPYAGPAAFVPSPLISPTASNASATPPQYSHLEPYSTIFGSMGSPSQHKVEQQVVRPHRMITPPQPTVQNQYVQISSSSPNVTRPLSPSTVPLHLHAHSSLIPHTLSVSTPSQVVLQYADTGYHVASRESIRKAEDIRPHLIPRREVSNGEVEKSRKYDLSPSAEMNMEKAANKPVSHHYEIRHGTHRVVHPSPADYNAQESLGPRASVMIISNSHTSTTDLEVQQAIDRDSSPMALYDKSNLNHGKAAFSPHSVIQTTHNPTEHLSIGLPASAVFPNSQQPLIGYISSQQQALSYHGNLQQHLVIPGTQPLLIPVCSTAVEASGITSTIATTTSQFAALPHSFVSTASPKSENYHPDSLVTQPAYHPTVVQAQVHLPLVQSVNSPVAASNQLPPYFMKGSIIQLANGELKRVEDLKTEDFIQSAEISSDLKIDSSTVERVEGSHNSSFALLQFAVGEHRTQVSVEVLMEHPFFVFGKGWSSCCPDRTSQLFGLPCSKLSVGDVCISLTLKNLKNGSIKKGQAGDSTGVLLKHPKNYSISENRPQHLERENGVVQGSVPVISENCKLKFSETITIQSARSWLNKTEVGRPPTRKRRWSAPETRKVEKTDEEQPLNLPKPSFIPQEVKICIEGRSNVGK